MTTLPFRTFSFHYRQKYGHPVGKIALDLGHICPNRAKGGCIYCSPSSYTPSYLNKRDDIHIQIAKAKPSFLKQRFSKYLAYFQQETTTSLEADSLLEIFEMVLADDDCLGLIISTRPDAIEKRLLTPLAHLVKKRSKECLFELGLQSAHDTSLKFLNRNHSFDDFVQAVQMIKEDTCFEVGAHLIFGIPGETRKDMLESLRRVCLFGVDALKLHHLQVIRGTQLETLYRSKSIQLFSMEEYFSFLMEALPRIPAHITLHRLWATSHPKMLLAPKWNVLATDLSRRLREIMIEHDVWQGKLWS